MLGSHHHGLSRLTLHQFRNYEGLDISFQKNAIVLTGMNGAGKTNILEAISLFSPGRGLRGIKLSEITTLNQRQDSPPSSGWAIAATLETDLGPIELGTALGHTATGTERRLIKANGHPLKSQASLTDWISVIWVTPQMDRLFLEAASIRRKFIDRLVYALDPSHAERTHRYEHYLRERARILREGSYDPLWVSTLEQRLAEDGVAITITRQQVAKSLEGAQRQEGNYPFPQFQADMKGELEIWTETQPALVAEDHYTERLKASRVHDGETGGASIGPHRSDFQVRHLAKQLPAELCSTGEQKMLLFALILAFIRIQERYHTCPIILLLDDVAAHLDDHHRSILFQEIGNLSQGVCQKGFNGHLQAWMTGTERASFRDLEGHAQFLTIHKATVLND